MKTIIAAALALMTTTAAAYDKVTITPVHPGGFPSMIQHGYAISRTPGVGNSTNVTVREVLPGGFPRLDSQSYNIKHHGNGSRTITPNYPGGFTNFGATGYKIDRR